MSPLPASGGALGVLAAAALAGAAAVVVSVGSPGTGAAPLGAAAAAPTAVWTSPRVAPEAAPHVPASAGRAVRAPRPPPRWAWPLEPVPRVARTFRPPTSPWGPGHRGLDLRAGQGQAVLAVEGGVVTHAGLLAGRGTVSVRHADGLVSTYEPVRTTLGVGDAVAAGEQLGVVEVRAAGSHCGLRVCLHLGARRGGAYLDPWSLLSGGVLALLPLGR